MILLKKITKMKTVGWKSKLCTQADNVKDTSFLVKITILAVKLRRSSIKEVRDTWYLLTNFKYRMIN